MKTWKDVAKRHRFWMDVMLWVNVFGVYMYLCLIGSSDLPTVILIAGLNTAMIIMARREEIKRDLAPVQEKDEMHTIIRRIK